MAYFRQLVNLRVKTNLVQLSIDLQQQSVKEDWERKTKDTKAVFIDLKKAYGTVRDTVVCRKERSHARAFKISFEQQKGMRDV